VKYLALIIIILSKCALSIEPMDDYYANDLLDAVDQAKSSPHHYDYSSTYRYKRTTAQSIELNRLKLEELDNTRLKTTGSSSLSKKAPTINDEVAIIASHPILTNTESNKVFIQTSHSNTSNTQYISNQGQLYSNGMIDQSNMTSMQRP
jgi:hypothetical protein